MIEEKIDVSFIDRNIDNWNDDKQNTGLIHRIAAIGAHLSNAPLGSAWAQCDSWRIGSPGTEVYQIESEDDPSTIKIQTIKFGEYLVDGKPIAAHLDGRQLSISYDNMSLSTYIVKSSPHSLYLWSNGLSHLIRFKNPLETDKKQSDKESHVKAPMTSKVISINVKSGEVVEKGQPLIIVEAMKMEHVIKAPKDGTIGSIYYKIGDIVQEGVDLLDFNGGNGGKPMAKAS